MVAIDIVVYSENLSGGVLGRGLKAVCLLYVAARQATSSSALKGSGVFSLDSGKNLRRAVARHDVLRVCDAIADNANQHGKSELKRIVSMLTRLIQRSQSVAEDAIEYEYECRKAKNHNSSDTVCFFRKQATGHTKKNGEY